MPPTKKKPKGDDIDALMAEAGIGADGGGGGQDDIDAMMAEAAVPPVPTEEADASAAGAGVARAAIPAALRPPAAVPQDSEASAAGQGAARAGAAAAPPPPSFLGRIGANLRQQGEGVVAEPGRAAKDPRGAAIAGATGVTDTMLQGQYTPEKVLERFRALRARTKDGTQFGDNNDVQEWTRYQRMASNPSRFSANEDASSGFSPDATEARLLESISAAERHPGMRTIGATVAPSPDKGFGKLAGGLIKGAGIVSRVARPVVSGMAAGATATAVPAFTSDQPIEDSLEQTLEGTIAGGGMGLASTAVPLAAKGVRKGLGVILPNVKRFAQARDAGLIPHAESLPEGRVGVQAAGEEAVDAITKRQGERRAEVGGRHAAAVEKYGPELADVQKMADELNPMRERNRMKPQGGRPGTMIKGRETLDAAARDTMNRVYEERNRTNNDMIEQRRALRESGAPGKPFPSEKQKANRKIGKALGKTLPAELEEADTAYARNERGTENENRTVFGKARPRTVNEAPGAPETLDPYERTTGGERLSRINDETEPAKRLQTRIEKLAERDPVYRQAIDRIVAKKALEETRFGRPGTGEQNTLPDVTGFNAALKLGKKQAGAAARRLDDKVLRPVSKANLAPFLGNYGRKRNREDEDRP